MNVTLNKGLLALCASIGLGFAAAPANAVPITPSPTLSLGSLTFSNFTCVVTQSGAPPGTPTCGGIDVSTNAGLPGLSFAGAFSQLSVLQVAAHDVLISYTVTDSGAPITGLDLDFNGTANAAVLLGGFAISQVTETAYTSLGGTQIAQLVVSCVDPGVCSGGSRQDVVSTGAYTSMYITKDILLSDFIGLSTISNIGQSFHQTVPEPMSLALFGSALVGLGLIRRKLS